MEDIRENDSLFSVTITSESPCSTIYSSFNVKATVVTKFIVAVVSITVILFFSAIIPLTIRQLIIIWFQRVVLTLILVTPIAFLLF